MAAVGGLVAIASLFKADYAVHSTEMPVDMDWLIAAIVKGGNKVNSERFPNKAAVKEFLGAINLLKANAEALPSKAKNKDELVKRVDALLSALYKPDSDGTLPLVTTALLSPIAGDSSACLAIVTGAKAAPLLLTKETIWGKGGRAFVYLPVQASIIQLSNEGKPVAMACRLTTVSAPIKLSELTRNAGVQVPWESGAAKPSAVVACDAATVSVQPYPR